MFFSGIKYKRFYFSLLAKSRLGFFLFLLLIAFSVSGQSFRKGPYLIYPGIPSEMTILWQTTSSSTCQIFWGTTTQYLDGTETPTESGTGNNEHQYIFTLENLQPDIRYFYRVICGNDTSIASFYSALPDTATQSKFLVFGDTRSHPEDMELVSAAMLSEIENDSLYQHLLIHSGDFNSNDAESTWDEQFFNRAYPNNLSIQSQIPIVGVRGNHEGTAIQYNKYWPFPYLNTGAYYSFDYGPMHIAVVDEYTDFTAGSAQLIWLENDLANSTKTWKFISLHGPGYTDESLHHNNTDVQDFIQPLCIQYNVKVVFSGHNHFYAHCLVDGVHHLTLGGGGAPLYTTNHIGEGLLLSESNFHFAEVNLTGDSLIIRALRLDGSVIDSLTLTNLVDAITPLSKHDEVKIIIIDKMMNISGLTGVSSIRIRDTNGKTFYSGKINSSLSQVDVSTYPVGVYIVSISGEKSINKKVVVH